MLSPAIRRLAAHRPHQAASCLVQAKMIAPPSYRLTPRSFAPSALRRQFSSDNEDDEVSMWDKPDLQRIFDNNLAWRRQMLDSDPNYFKDMSEGQEPEYLLIGCSDSRVGAQEIMGLHQGELFVHRNVANVVVSTDLNMLSVVFYAVNVLKVKEIIVLGHYGCGGVKAASENKDLGLIEHWLHNVRDVQRLHKDELAEITDPEERFKTLVELNVKEQCFNLFSNSIVQQMQAKSGRPRIHGMVYDISNGRLKYLDIDWKNEIKKFRDIYAVADFRSKTPVNISDFEQDPEVAREERRELARLLFEDIDADGNGTLDRDELREAMDRYGGGDVSEEELDEMMRPFVGMARENFDLDAFESILHSLHKDEQQTDRLVVIKPPDGQEPPSPLRCRGSTTVLELKQAIKSLTGVPVESQGLYHEGILLKNDLASLTEVGISDISEVELKEEIVPSAFQRP